MRVDNREIRDAQIFEILLDNFPDIIHSVDENGDIVFTNKKAESLLGYTRAELLSMKVRQIYAEEVLTNMNAGFDKLKKTGDFSVESLLKAKDGTKIPVEIRSFSIYDDNGTFIRTFSILRDIRAIKDLQNSLVHAGRLAAIGEMSSGVAHDINNPLTVIMLANQMLQREVERLKEGTGDSSFGRVKSCSDDIGRASRSIEKLVTHLRNFSRGMKEKIELVDIHDTIVDSVFITSNRSKAASVTVRHDIQPSRHFTEASPNQLEQVFVNLISNACDAMNGLDKRELTIHISETDRDGTACWKCDVTDTGTGIPANLLEDIFGAFFTTKEKGKGTGLGLSISRGIIKEHGGEITVSSEVGKGTTFSVFLKKAGNPASQG